MRMFRQASSTLGGSDVSQQRCDSRIEYALELFRQNPAVSMADIAAILHLSSSRFRHLFRKQAGLSPRRYKRLMQLRQARNLLEETYLSVKEVISMVGLKDISHFTRDYKARYKQTPAQTRLQSHKNQLNTAITANK